MESDKSLSVRVPRFKGTPEKWPAWRDTMEAIFGAYKLIGAINKQSEARRCTSSSGGGESSRSGSSWWRGRRRRR